ncbi:MAG: hypothetical protein KatS3mg115_1971 [Candidatus Poribacteria bacterium]|nr:MAG: hypothetical protein KatS3mg115_1971 [Candidatus Poribacteria bacterium]
MVQALREKGIPVAYLEFPGEHHGFRMPGNVVRAREAEHYFYAAILGLELDAPIEPIPIENWQGSVSVREE